MSRCEKTILVSGADGFIGSHLCEELVKLGHRVRAFVFYNSFNTWGWLDSIPMEIRNSLEVISGDIRDFHGVYTAMRGCDMVFHLAALVAIPYSYYSPESYVETNIKGTLNVLQAARQLGTEKLVHTSSSEVYGTARFVPIDEEHPLQGQSPYSATKIAADQLAISFYRSFDTPVAIIRPFNTYGPRQSTRAVIPTIITQILMGNTYIKLGSLHPSRDFNFIKDTISGFIAIGFSAAAIGKVINIGTNYEITIGKLTELICELMNVEAIIVSDEPRVRPSNSEVDRLLASNVKAGRLLGWHPAYGGYEGLTRGLVETIDWFKRPENLNKYKMGTYTL